MRTRLPAVVTALSLAFLSLFAAPLWAAEGQPVDTGDLPPTGWKGEAAIGGSLATGNTDRQSMDADVKATYRAGPVEDKYKLLAELAREDGDITAQRLIGGIQSNFDIAKSIYVLGFTEAEADEFSGFDYEIDTGAGAGYRVFDTNDLSLSFEAALGYRFNREEDTGLKNNQLFARTNAIFSYQMSESAKITNESLITYDSDRTQFESTTAISSTLIWSLAGRASFNVRHNTNPPLGILKTDTITKIALVYNF